MNDLFLQALMIPTFAFILSMLLILVDWLFVVCGWGTCERCHKRDQVYTHPDGGPGGVCKKCVNEL